MTEDLERLENSLYETRYRYHSRQRVERILRLYVWLGVSGTLIGGLAFLFVTLDIKLAFEQQLTLMVAGVSFLTAVASFLLLRLRQETWKQQEEVQRNIEGVTDFLRQWAAFEAESRRALATETDYNKYSIKQTLDLLHREGKISESDVIALEEAIQARNALVHGGTEMSQQQLSKYVSAIAEVVRKLALK